MIATNISLRDYNSVMWVQRYVAFPRGSAGGLEIDPKYSGRACSVFLYVNPNDLGDYRYRAGGIEREDITDPGALRHLESIGFLPPVVSGNKKWFDTNRKKY